MTEPKRNPIPALECATEALWIVEDGEEWSLLDVMMQVSPSDWNDFAPARSQPVNLREIVASLHRLPRRWKKAMTGSPHTLKSFHDVRADLARMFASAAPEMRTKITRALFEAENKMQVDPLSCSAPLYDLPLQTMQARVAFFLPLAVFFAVDEKKNEVYIHTIDLIEAPGEPSRRRATRNSAC
jgi:hypothetical protein